MTTESITADVSDCRERVAADEDTRLIEVTRLPETDVIELATPSLSDALDLALDLDGTECYLQVDRTDAGDVTRAVFAFFHEGVLHVASRTTDSERATDATQADDSEQASALPPVRDDSLPTDAADSLSTDAADPVEEKATIAEELLSDYSEYLDEGDKYQLTYRLESTTLPQLERMRDEAAAAATADTDAEERLARIVFRDGRFNEAYTVADTEMLLNALDVAYDPESVRLEEVHRTAMGLRMVNE